MITPKLEKLIWEGKAFFKTYNAGPQKSTLDIENDRFIIITDIIFSGFFNEDPDLNFFNMQLAIYGEKGFNHYVFRNRHQTQFPVYDGVTVVDRRLYTTVEPQKIDTYLLHTTQVGFSFMGNNQLTNLGVGNFQELNPGYQPPLEYGKEGDVGVIPVTVDAEDTTNAMRMQFQNTRNPNALAGNVVTNQIQYPASVNTLPGAGVFEYCIATINYVEVLGQPDNIEF